MTRADTHYSLAAVPRGESAIWDGNLDGLDGPCDLVLVLQREEQEPVEAFRWRCGSVRAAKDRCAAMVMDSLLYTTREVL